MNEKIAVSIKEASALTSIGVKSLREWAANDPQFPVFKVGVKMLIPVRLLTDYLAKKALRRDGIQVVQKEKSPCRLQPTKARK